MPWTALGNVAGIYKESGRETLRAIELLDKRLAELNDTLSRATARGKSLVRHSSLQDLDYSSSQHTGFEATLTSPVTPGSYTAANITVNAKGQVTAAADGTVQAFPVGSVFIAVVSTYPGTLLGYGTWSSFGAGRVLVGLNSSDTDFDTVEETGGAKTVAASGTVSQPTFTGSALASHDHDYTSVIEHYHNLDPALPRNSASGSDNTKINAIPDTSATASNGLLTSGSLDSGGSSNGVTTGTTTADSAGTPAGTVSQPTFTGSATSVVQPYIVVYMWKRTA